MSIPLKPIAYTVGEPAGIGIDILLKLAKTEDLSGICVLGDRDAILSRAERLKTHFPKKLDIEHIAIAKPEVCGIPSSDNARGVLEMLNVAIDGCIEGDFSAMVTGPLHKGVINEAGIPFSGHTEYLAERTDASLPVMLLATETLRVALVTTHIPLKDVANAITEDLISEICLIIHRDFQAKYGVGNPRILVCGLNPHAGEGGHLGMEEIEIIEPALNSLRERGVDVVGPLPADTLFTPKYLEGADVALAMYHDQGLPVLKYKGFGNAANITLGLPIVRTSVDHGTAFDLAGTGKADNGSLLTAMDVARHMVRSG